MLNSKISLKAYAKINITLDCVGKRPDGYHLLRSIMHPISLFDTVTIERTLNNGILVDCTSVECKQNIVLKTANVFFDFCDITEKNRNINISIEKNIPLAAGLGGGSTDAAATILILNSMFETHLTSDKLINIAEKVGADVPFCLFNKTAVVEGIGEKLSFFDSFPSFFFILVKPFEKGSTAQMYKKLDEFGISGKDYTDKVLSSLQVGDTIKMCENFGNEFSCFWENEKTLYIKDCAKYYGALNTSLTGSGPTFFSVFNNETNANKYLNKISQTFSDVYLAKSVN